MHKVCIPALALTCFVVLAMASTAADATFSQSVDALQLVLDPVEGTTTLDSLAPGQVVEVSAVVDRLSGVTLQSFQIGLDYDASLRPIGVSLHPDTGTSLRPTLTDVYVGLSSFLLASDGPHVLATWYFMREPGYAATDPATIRIRDLENGEPSLYLSMAPAYHRAEFRDVGPVRIGNVGPGVWRFMATSLDFVEGRSYSLEWETSGLGSLTLDGLSVSDVGNESFVVSGPTAHRLRYTDAAGIHERELSIDAIREPRVDLLVSEDPPREGSDLHRVIWKIAGATATWWGADSELVSNRGERGVSTSTPTAVTIRGENEWGMATRTIALNSDGKPMIGFFGADPSPIDAGEQSRLIWSVVNADEVTVDPPGVVGEPDGSLVLRPDSTTTYTLVASGATGTSEATTMIDVIPVRIHSFGVTPDELYPGESVDLSWSVSGADSVWIDPGIGGVDPVSGTMTHVPEEAKVTYVLHARRGSHEVTRFRYISWKLPFASLWPDDPYMTPEEMMLAHFLVVGADSAYVEPLHFKIDPPNGTGSLMLPGAEPTDFVLNAFNRAGVTHAKYPYHAYPPALRFAYVENGPLYLGMKFKMRIYTIRTTHFELTGSTLFHTPLIRDSIDLDDPIPYTFWLDEPETLVFDAENYLFSVSDTTIIGEGAHHLEWITVDDPVVELGDSTTLRWGNIFSAPMEDAHLEPLDIDVWHNWHMVIHPETTTMYRITQRYGEPLSTYRATTLVTVVNGETSLVAEPMDPIRGDVFQLHISMPGDATSATLGPNVGTISPTTQTLPQIAGERQEYSLQVTTPRGLEQATVLVEPVDVTPVPTLVQHLEFDGRCRGEDIVLTWDIRAAGKAEDIRIERRVGSSPAQNLGPFTKSSGNYVDSSVETGVTYTYRLDFSVAGNRFQSDTVEVVPTRVVRTRMLPNVPNPFNPSTRIRWELAESSDVRIEIHDIRGRRIRSEELGRVPSGPGSWVWDGKDRGGSVVASGTYIVRFVGGARSLAQKVVMSK